MIDSLTHSLTHSLARSLTHSLTQSINQSIIHSSTYSSTHPLIHSLARSLAHVLIHSLARSLTYSLTFLLRTGPSGAVGYMAGWRCDGDASRQPACKVCRNVIHRRELLCLVKRSMGNGTSGDTITWLAPPPLTGN